MRSLLICKPPFFFLLSTLFDCISLFISFSLLLNRSKSSCPLPLLSYLNRLCNVSCAWSPPWRCLPRCRLCRSLSWPPGGSRATCQAERGARGSFLPGACFMPYKRIQAIPFPFPFPFPFAHVQQD